MSKSIDSEGVQGTLNPLDFECARLLESQRPQCVWDSRHLLTLKCLAHCLDSNVLRVDQTFNCLDSPLNVWSQTF